ncbi:hypothetical protein [Clavibacter michiganensis]|uniref:hypothetical protein n=1 Tax=Clavibacter michiganensis TaxID=28447 RepID=UPI00292D2002|nr:hypothetical protein [Clavibacter michiganensis]
MTELELWAAFRDDLYKASQGIKSKLYKVRESGDTEAEALLNRQGDLLSEIREPVEKAWEAAGGI